MKKKRVENFWKQTKDLFKNIYEFSVESMQIFKATSHRGDNIVQLLTDTVESQQTPENKVPPGLEKLNKSISKTTSQSTLFKFEH